MRPAWPVNSHRVTRRPAHRRPQVLHQFVRQLGQRQVPDAHHGRVRSGGSPAAAASWRRLWPTATAMAGVISPSRASADQNADRSGNDVCRRGRPPAPGFPRWPPGPPRPSSWQRWQWRWCRLASDLTGQLGRLDPLRQQGAHAAALAVDDDKLHSVSSFNRSVQRSAVRQWPGNRCSPGGSTGQRSIWPHSGPFRSRTRRRWLSGDDRPGKPTGRSTVSSDG